MFDHLPNGGSLRRPLCVSVLVAFVSLIGLPKAEADTPAQVQKVIQATCDRSVASYNHRDLPGVMAMYAPSFVSRNVSGRRANFLQNQAGMANIFARDNSVGVGRCVVSQVTLQGDEARAVLKWRYTTRHPRTATTPAYTFVRDYEEQSVWKKLAGGWHETNGQLTRDVLEYLR